MSQIVAHRIPILHQHLNPLVELVPFPAQQIEHLQCGIRKVNRARFVQAREDLLAFGAACLISIWLTGRHIDRHLRIIAMAAAALFSLAAIGLATAPPTALIWALVILWGLSWGGVPTVLQTAAPRAASRLNSAATDTAQAILVTLWNAAMAVGGLPGGIVLAGQSVAAIPATAALFVGASLVVIVAAHRYGCPARSAAAAGDDTATSRSPQALRCDA